MARILVNDTEHQPNPGPETWGELLRTLDESLGEEGRLVTAARFDGVDQPSFRDAEIESKALTSLSTVEVRTEQPGTLLSNCLGEAEAGVAAMGAAVLRLGEMFRGQDVALANSGLAHVGDDLRALVALIQALGGPIGVDLDRLVVDGKNVPEHLGALAGLLETMVEAQQAHDWLTVADILEFDLEPALRGWQAIFDTLRSFLAKGRPALAAATA
ncbi:MAG: hypothetical protein Q8L86_03865 [Vicinamibacterales bacterium]|nr:hypothetical protein [Vicinamibacterales bacterium]